MVSNKYCINCCYFKIFTEDVDGFYFKDTTWCTLKDTDTYELTKACENWSGS